MGDSLSAVMQFGAATLEIIINILPKYKMKLPYDLSITLFGICTEDFTFYSTNTCTSVFLSTILTIAKELKQPKCPSTDKSIMKIWYIYKVTYYSTTKKMKSVNVFPYIYGHRIIKCNPDREKNKH